MGLGAWHSQVAKGQGQVLRRWAWQTAAPWAVGCRAGAQPGPWGGSPSGQCPRGLALAFPRVQGVCLGPMRSFLVATEPADTLSCWAGLLEVAGGGGGTERGEEAPGSNRSSPGPVPCSLSEPRGRRVLMTVTALIIKYKMRQLTQC